MYIKHVDKFVAGAGAGVTAVALTYPLDTIRARLAFQVTGEHKYSGIIDTATTIFRNVSNYLLSNLFTSESYNIIIPILFIGRWNSGIVPWFCTNTNGNGSLCRIFILLL